MLAKYQPGEAGSALVHVDGLAKRYAEGRGVAHVSLQLRRHEVLGFVGPNGAGKTTTLRMLAGLIRPDSGTGCIVGRDVNAAERGSSRVGYMPQKLALYSELSVADNLRFRADIYCLSDPAARVRRALGDFGLEDRRRQPAGELSGGWARRLQLAAALIHSPDLVLLDEPTAGLDGESREDVWKRIQALAGAGAGVIVNTHDLLEAERCSRVALFRDGEIVTQGAPADICEAAPLRAALVQCSDVNALRTAVESDPGLLTLEPHGRRLRILTTAEGFDALCSALRAQGAMVTADETRLADVALVNERTASQTIGAVRSQRRSA
jgi:ABC-2 type transport system ATP-binding protein